MKCFTYFLCCWFAFLTIGCASHRTETPASTNGPVSSTTTDTPPAATAPVADHGSKHPLLETAGIFTVSLLVFPIMLIAGWLYGPMC